MAYPPFTSEEQVILINKIGKGLFMASLIDWQVKVMYQNRGAVIVEICTAKTRAETRAWVKERLDKKGKQCSKAS